MLVVLSLNDIKTWLLIATDGIDEIPRQPLQATARRPSQNTVAHLLSFALSDYLHYQNNAILWNHHFQIIAERQSYHICSYHYLKAFHKMPGNTIFPFISVAWKFDEHFINISWWYFIKICLYGNILSSRHYIQMSFQASVYTAYKQEGFHIE